jgi:hypothetical protein
MEFSGSLSSSMKVSKVERRGGKMVVLSSILVHDGVVT